MSHSTTLLWAALVFAVAISAQVGAQIIPPPEGAKTTGQYPYGLTRGLTNSTNTGVEYCQQSTPSNNGFDYVSEIQLTTEISSQRLVGIEMTCSEGTSFSAYSGGRTGPTSDDVTTSATGNNFKGGFNGVTVTSGLVGEPAQDGGDIVSGLQFDSIASCSAPSPNVTASVVGGSNNTFYGNPAFNRSFCGDGDLLIGFQYGTEDYFEGLMPLYYAF